MSTRVFEEGSCLGEILLLSVSIGPHVLVLTYAFTLSPYRSPLLSLSLLLSRPLTPSLSLFFLTLTLTFSHCLSPSLSLSHTHVLLLSGISIIFISAFQLLRLIPLVTRYHTMIYHRFTNHIKLIFTSLFIFCLLYFFFIFLLISILLLFHYQNLFKILLMLHRSKLRWRTYVTLLLLQQGHQIKTR